MRRAMQIVETDRMSREKLRVIAPDPRAHRQGIADLFAKVFTEHGASAWFIQIVHILRRGYAGWFHGK